VVQIEFLGAWLRPSVWHTGPVKKSEPKPKAKPIRRL